VGVAASLFIAGLLLCVLLYRRRVRYKKNTRELDIVVGGLIDGFAEGIDDDTPVEVGLVLGWLDGDAKVEGLALDGTPVEVGLVLGWLDGDAEIEGCA
jgi:hypothetical protein